MTHEALREMLLDLAYGELSGRDAREVEAHAGSCEACRAELSRIRETRAAMSALPVEQAPERGEGVLLAAARERTRARKPARWIPRWLLAGSVAAVSAGAVIAISYRLLEMRPGPLGRSDQGDLLGEARPAQRAAGPEAAPAAPGDGAATKSGEGSAAGSSGQDRFAFRDGRGAGDGAIAPPAKAKGAPAREPTRFAEPPAARGELAASSPRPAPAPARAGDLAAEPRFAEAPPAASEHPAAPAKAERKAAVRAPAASGSQEAPAGAATADEMAVASAEREAAPAAARSRSASAAAPSAAPSAALAARGAGPAPAAQRPAEAAGEAVSAVRAVRRYEALRAEGRLSAEIRTFPGCAGEGWRKVERDPEGRVVAWVREGTIRGARFRAEAIYGEDGRLARARALPLGGGPAPEASALVPPDATGARIDAPPRCGP